MEEWRDIEGYEGKYQVSNLGRVRALNYKRSGEIRIINQSITANGYKRVELYKYGKRKNARVHRLVAQAFLKNPNNYPQVNHKDENKLNNNVKNLEWCTSEYNNNYGTLQERAAISRAKKIKCITTGEEFDCIKKAAKKYNTYPSNIINCCKNKYRFAGKLADGTKLVWKYI